VQVDAVRIDRILHRGDHAGIVDGRSRLLRGGFRFRLDLGTRRRRDLCRLDFGRHHRGRRLDGDCRPGRGRGCRHWRLRRASIRAVVRVQQLLMGCDRLR
jgi:hypothetical protein